MWRNEWLLGLTLLGLTCLTGCEAGVGAVPVKGTAKYDGQPLTSGTVQFVPTGDGMAAMGQIQPDGSFQLTTQLADDGALPGQYKVSVQVFPDPASGGGGMGLPGAEFGDAEPPIPVRYNNPETSGLTATVTDSGENEIVLELTK